MGNPLPKTVLIGTLGELLVQLRLLEFGVQAAAPIKDSGNDLIAIKREVVKFIQIKTKLNGRTFSSNLPEIYHLLFLVELELSKNNGISLDRSNINVFDKSGLELGPLTLELVDRTWN